jgi:GT2 family glycosyltransferase
MVSIIIVNYHTSHLLLHCVDAIEEQVKGVDYEIIVADNASSEEELVLLRDDKRFTLLELDENIGLVMPIMLLHKWPKVTICCF